MFKRKANYRPNWIRLLYKIQRGLVATMIDNARQDYHRREMKPPFPVLNQPLLGNKDSLLPTYTKSFEMAERFANHLTATVNGLDYEYILGPRALNTTTHCLENRFHGEDLSELRAATSAVVRKFIGATSPD